MSSSLPEQSLSDTGSKEFLDEVNVRASQKKRAKAAARLFQKKGYKMSFDTIDDSRAEKIRVTMTTKKATTALTTNVAKTITVNTPTIQIDSNAALTDSDSSLATDIIDPADDSTCGDIETGIDTSDRSSISSIQDESLSSSSLDRSSDHKNPRTNTPVAGNNNNGHLTLASASPSPSGRYSRRRSSTSSHRSYCSAQLGTIPETDVTGKSSHSYITNMSNHSSMYAHEFYDDEEEDDDEEYADHNEYDHFHERQNPSAPASAAADTASTSDNESDIDIDIDIYEGKTVHERRESSGNRRMNVVLLGAVGCFLVISLAIAVALGIVLHTKHDQSLVLENDDYIDNDNTGGNDFYGGTSNIFTNDILLNEGGD